jgi:hypothetical protein
MQPSRLQATHAGKRFLIEDGGGGVGYYLYVFDNGRCTHDYLQDTVDLAKLCAAEEFGVPLQNWNMSAES